MIHLPRGSDGMLDVAEAYTHFFPIYAEDSNRTQLAPLKAMGEYEAPTPLPITKEDMASITSFLMDRQDNIVVDFYNISSSSA